MRLHRPGLWMLLGLFLLPLGASAQDPQDLAKKRDEKLAAEWIKKGGWITDYDQALAEAKKSDKIIFAYFTRSYAY